MHKPDWKKRKMLLDVWHGRIVSPRVEAMFRNRIDKKPKKPGIGKRPTRFQVVQYFVNQISEDGGEFTAARLNDWILSHNRMYAMGRREAGFYLSRMRNKLGIEICYKDNARGQRRIHYGPTVQVVWTVKKQAGRDSDSELPDTLG